MITTLPTDSKERKDYALFSGCLRYFPAALAGVAKTSKLGNDKHNPGQEMHHARNKSGDHGDCILRHLMDLEDLLAARNRGDTVDTEYILNEVSSMAWRALALSQEIHEEFGAPLAPGAKNDVKEEFKRDDNTILFELNKMKQDEKSDFIQKKRFFVGEPVKHINNDLEVTVQGVYWDCRDKPILFVNDSDNKIFGVDPNFYKSIYKDGEKNANN